LLSIQFYSQEAELKKNLSGPAVLFWSNSIAGLSFNVGEPLIRLLNSQFSALHSTIMKKEKMRKQKQANHPENRVFIISLSIKSVI
jgi:hypothetical protein